MTAPDPSLSFTDEELIMLGRTADGLSAYMGVSVLAEVGCDDDTQAQWVIFAVPLGVDEEADEKTVHVQIGGPGTQLLGGRGGLDPSDDVYDCRYLWAIQITDDPEARYIRLDDQGEEFDYSNHLGELLPFETSDEELPDPDLELLEPLEDDDGENGQEDDDEPGADLGRPRGPSIH
ncbi:MAG: hypothetical protein IT507_01565 [Burkholderiaceae bacterium]|nr:hypothetical protein [Burkholderiaceae bacterium]